MCGESDEWVVMVGKSIDFVNLVTCNQLIQIIYVALFLNSFQLMCRILENSQTGKIKFTMLAQAGVKFGKCMYSDCHIIM